MASFKRAIPQEHWDKETSTGRCPPNLFTSMHATTLSGDILSMQKPRTQTDAKNKWSSDTGRRTVKRTSPDTPYMYIRCVLHAAVTGMKVFFSDM